MKLIKAEKEHLGDIARLMHKVHIKNVKDKNTGFMTKMYTKEMFENILTVTKDFYVVEDEGHIVGYIMGGDENLGLPFVDIKEKFEHLENFFFVKHICVDQDYPKKGIGTFIYEKIFEKTKDRHICLTISEEPINTASMNFHKKHGFEKIDSYNEGGYKWALMRKEPH